MAVGEDHSYRVFLCASSRATHVVWFRFLFGSRCHSTCWAFLSWKSPTEFTPTVARTPSTCDQKSFFARHIIGNILVASRRLVMHTCESHDEGMICFFKARDPSCACSTLTHTTIRINSANCRTTSGVRICWCVVLPKMRSAMSRQ